MVESYSLGVYWGARKESAWECAQRMARCLSCLADCDASLSQWYQTGDSLEEALQHEVRLSEEALESLLLASRNRSGNGRDVFEALGFTVGLWNGDVDPNGGVGIMMSCGKYAPIPAANFCSLDWPRQGPLTERLLQLPALLTLLECQVTAWQPEWGVVESRTYRELMPFPTGGEPSMGWLVYLSDTRGTIPPLPSPARVVRLDSYGSVIVLTEERFTASSPEHVAHAARVGAMLGDAGLLKPLWGPPELKKSWQDSPTPSDEPG